MNWLTLIEQLLPSIFGIIAEILKAVNNTPAVQAPLAAHIATAVQVIKANTPPSA